VPYFPSSFTRQYLQVLTPRAPHPSPPLRQSSSSNAKIPWSLSPDDASHDVEKHDDDGGPDPDAGGVSSGDGDGGGGGGGDGGDGDDGGGDGGGGDGDGDDGGGDGVGVGFESDGVGDV